MLQLNHMTNFPSPLPYSIGYKRVIGSAHTEGEEFMKAQHQGAKVMDPSLNPDYPRSQF